MSFLLSQHQLLESMLGTFWSSTMLISPIGRTVLFGAGSVCLGIGYLVSLGWASRNNVTSSQIRRARLFVVSLVLLFSILPPFLSTDVISYYQQGWIFSHQKANPYLISPGDFANPPGKDLLLHGQNLYALTPYGSLWTVLEGCIYWMSGGSLWLGIVFFKILAAISSLIVVFIIARIVRYLNPNYELTSLIFLGAHPLLLVEGPGMAHSDIASLVFVALGIWALVSFRSKTRVVTFLLMTAIITKAYAIPVIILFLWWLIRQDKTNGNRWAIIDAIITIAILFAIATIPFVEDYSDIFRLFAVGDPHPMVKVTETPYTIVFILKKLLIFSSNFFGFILSQDEIARLARRTIFFSATLIILYLFKNIRTLESFCLTLGPIYMIVNMAFSYWRPWYVLWPLVLVSLFPHRKWAIAIALYGWLALITYIITPSSGICLPP